jgi:hypothetical protein
VIVDETTGQRLQAQPLPDFLLDMLADGGLVPHLEKAVQGEASGGGRHDRSVQGEPARRRPARFDVGVTRGIGVAAADRQDQSYHQFADQRTLLEYRTSGTSSQIYRSSR